MDHFLQRDRLIIEDLLFIYKDLIMMIIRINDPCV